MIELDSGTKVPHDSIIMADVDFKDTDVENPLLKEAVMQETEMKLLQRFYLFHQR